MKCSRCSTQWENPETNCPYCGEVVERSEVSESDRLYSGAGVLCLYCPAMVPYGNHFCSSCGREQTRMQPRKASSSTSSKTGEAIGWTCGGCAVVSLIAFLTILAVATAFFKSLVGA